MKDLIADFVHFAQHHHPFDLVPKATLEAVGSSVVRHSFEAGDQIIGIGDPIDGFFLVRRGQVEIESPERQPVARLSKGEGFGARALLRGRTAEARAVAVEPTKILTVPRESFLDLVRDFPGFGAYYDRVRRPSERRAAATLEPANMLISNQVSDIMTRDAVAL